MKHTTLVIGAAITACLAPAASAQDYPQEDLRIVVPWGAGGGVDTIVRKLVSIAEEDFPQAIFVENLEGGLSAVGLQQVMSAPADGYTMGVLTYDSVISVPWRGLVPDYDLDSLKVIARVTSEPNAMMVNASSDYESFDQLMQAAEEDPRSIRVSVDGLGSMPHLSLLRLEHEMDVSFRPVPYPNGSAGQKEALLSGEVDASISSLGDFAPLLQDDTVRGLVEFSETQNPAFSDVPPSGDVGLDMATGSFLLFAVPEGTPEEVVSYLESMLQSAYETNEFQDWAKNTGVSPDWLGEGEVTEWMNGVQSEITAQLDDLAEQGVIQK